MHTFVSAYYCTCAWIYFVCKWLKQQIVYFIFYDDNSNNNIESTRRSWPLHRLKIFCDYSKRLFSNKVLISCMSSYSIERYTQWYKHRSSARITFYLERYTLWHSSIRTSDTRGSRTTNVSPTAVTSGFDWNRSTRLASAWSQTGRACDLNVYRRNTVRTRGRSGPMKNARRVD